MRPTTPTAQAPDGPACGSVAVSGVAVPNGGGAAGSRCLPWRPRRRWRTRGEARRGRPNPPIRAAAGAHASIGRGRLCARRGRGGEGWSGVLRDSSSGFITASGWSESTARRHLPRAAAGRTVEPLALARLELRRPQPPRRPGGQRQRHRLRARLTRVVGARDGHRRFGLGAVHQPPRRGPGVFTPARTGTALSVQAFDAFWCTVRAEAGLA